MQRLVLCAVLFLSAFLTVEAFRMATASDLQTVIQHLDHYKAKHEATFGDSIRAARHRAGAIRAQEARDNGHHDDDDGDHEGGHPIPQQVGDPLPLWTTPTFLHGKSQFILSSPGNTRSSLTGYVSPNVLIVDPAKQLFYINDPITGQLTNASGSWSWFITAESYPNFQCFVDFAATYASQVPVHKTSTKRDLNSSIEISVADKERPGHYRTVSVPTYTYDGFTRDYGGGYDSWLSFDVNVNVNTLRPYQFFFGQGAGGPRGASCPSPCTTGNNVVAGEYVYHGPGSADLPVSAVTPADYALPPECLVPANNLDYQSHNCFT